MCPPQAVARTALLRSGGQRFSVGRSTMVARLVRSRQPRGTSVAARPRAQPRREVARPLPPCREGKSRLGRGEARPMAVLKRALASFVVCLAAIPATAEVTAVRFSRLLTMRGTPVIDGVVVVEDKRIKAVGA